MTQVQKPGRDIIVVSALAKEGQEPVEVRWVDGNRHTVNQNTKFMVSVITEEAMNLLVLDFATVQKLHEELALMLEIEEDIREGRDDRVGVGYFSRRRAR